MAIPIRNRVFDKIQTAGSLTDAELSKALAKDDAGIGEGGLNKILLDLEIMGLVNVSWITKDTRRVEVTKQAESGDGADEQGREAEERDYEASFPGADA